MHTRVQKPSIKQNCFFDTTRNNQMMELSLYPMYEGNWDVLSWRFFFCHVLLESVRRL